VYVKSLTLRGFKSFASATGLKFEPGITCVVGPNGSGKSNIVDAFAWVMGEQGVKSLRGGKMDDVVFAGTASRPPLGRAEVTLTIDNSDGSLPIDYTEVTISRLLFRSGQSEYAINGNHCRLLDVAELLSDSGLGREMHVIVGQGQLDEVLHAGPEARRALIEEAAGVLKHRRRKEKALRKLEAMQANLTRLVDLTAEVRRRLGPLGRQAAIARRAAVIQADLRDSRLRLLADDYSTGATDLERGEADEAAVLARRTELETVLARARQQETALDADEQEHAPRLARAQQTWFELSALSERLRGVSNLARERHAHLATEQGPARPGRDPDELEEEAASLREQEAVLGERLEGARERMTAAGRQRQSAEGKLSDAEKTLAREARAAAERAEQLSKLRGQVGAARSRVAAAQEEATRLADAFEQARSRATTTQREYEEFSELASGRQDDRAALKADHERVATVLAECSSRAAERRAAERRAIAERAGLLARTQALEEGIHALQQGADASAVLLADPQWAGEVLGNVTNLLTVTEGAQEAITAALGGAADAVAVAGLDAAVRILAHLKDDDGGTTGLVIAGGTPGSTQSRAREAGGLPTGATPALDLVTGPAELASALAGLLGDVVVAPDLAAARDCLRAGPGLRVVTRDGDLVGAHWAHGGSARPPGKLSMRAAADEAAAGLATAEDACTQAAEALAEAVAGEEQAREAVNVALAGLQAADKAAADVSGRLGRLAGAARAAQEEAARLETAIDAATTQRERDQEALTELSGRLSQAESGEREPGEAEQAQVAEQPAEPDRDALAEAADAAREAEMEARLEVRTAEERLGAIAGRADALAAAAVRERRAAQAAEERSRQRAQQAAVAGAVARGTGYALERITESLSAAAAQRQAAEVASQGRAGALKEVRAQVRTLASELDKVVEGAHGAEIAHAEQRMRLEQIAARAADEFGVDVIALVAEYGPQVLVPMPEPAEDEGKRTRRNAKQSRQNGPTQPGGSTAQPGAPESASNGSHTNGAPAHGVAANGAAANGSVPRPAANGSAQDAAANGAAGNGSVPGPAANGSAQDAAPGGATGNEATGNEATGNEATGNGAAANGATANGAAANGAHGPAQPPVPAQGAPAAQEMPAAGPSAPVQAVPAAGPAPQAASGERQASGAAVQGMLADGAVRFIPYVRAEQEKRAATAQRQLDQLGKVNPLALEEFEALEERHAFLASQLEDLKKTRRDLLTVVKEVDDRVQQVFASAYADTAAEFSQIFERLFPGGEGRLVLTEPDDMLATGIDVEARPPGKKVKRLSLLSGGERSLTAIAYLVAIFKARPSPFYVLDEVEAALDDTNLQRLLTIFDELRNSSQLIIVTHQRRTMEVADALYGISMRGDGVSTVVSQRLREYERA
jgi:chromosome segregation protein